MFNLSPEIARLRDDGIITPATAAPLIAAENREVVTLYGELRFLMWGGVMLVVTGVGVLVSKHLDDIGPLAIALGIGLASALCYAWATWKRNKTASLVDDYVLLLAALLLSADVGFIEHTWHLLGANWNQHLLFLAIVHAATAYAFDSRLVLSVSLTSLAAYLGIRRDVDALFSSSTDTAIRAFVCATIVFIWRTVHVRLCGAGNPAGDAPVAPDAGRIAGATRNFTPVFDHFAATLAFWGGLILSFGSDTHLLGSAITIALAVASARYGFKTRSEMFVIYAWIYGLVAVNVGLDYLVAGDLAPFLAMVSSIVAIIGLFVIHTRMKKEAA